MALPVEQVRTTAQALEYRPRSYERPRALPWERLRSISAEVKPAWSGAEVVVALAFEGDRPSPDGVPLAAGRRLEVFGHVRAARALIQAAQQRSPQALVGPQAQLLISLPEPDDQDEPWLRRKTKEYGFAAEAGLSLGKLHLWRGRLEAADNDLQRVVARAPLDTGAWRWLGLARVLAGRGGDARAALERLIALGARDAEAYYLHALSLYGQRRFAQAAEGFGRVLRAEPYNPAVCGLLACSLVQQWLVEDALRELDRVAAEPRQGWRLMAQKCSICAQGYRAYQERLSRDRWFRWRKWLGRAGAWAAVVIGALIPVLRERDWWLLLIAALPLLFHYVSGRSGVARGAQDQLADAQGQVPNMPCWYASLVGGRRRPRLAGRSIMQQLQRRWGDES